MLATVMEDLNWAIVLQSCEQMLMDSNKIFHSFKDTYDGISQQMELLHTQKQLWKIRRCQLFSGCAKRRYHDKVGQIESIPPFGRLVAISAMCDKICQTLQFCNKKQLWKKGDVNFPLLVAACWLCQNVMPCHTAWGLWHMESSSSPSLPSSSPSPLSSSMLTALSASACHVARHKLVRA